MNKKEKELAAKVLASYLADARALEMSGDIDGKERKLEYYKRYADRLREMLTLRFDLFTLPSYKRAVMDVMNAIYKLAGEYYSQLVNGEYID